MKARKFKVRVLASDETPQQAFRSSALKTFNSIKKGKQLSDSFTLTIPLSSLPKIFSPERMRIIMTVQEKNPRSIYELAQMLGREQSAVHKDVHELAGFGIIVLNKTKKEGSEREISTPECPWDTIEVIKRKAS